MQVIIMLLWSYLWGPAFPRPVWVDNSGGSAVSHGMVSEMATSSNPGRSR